MIERLNELRTPLRHTDMRVVWIAQILSEVGDWAARLALAVLIFERTGSPSLTALATALSVLPWVGLGQFLATIGDRYGRRGVMVTSDVVRAALFLLMMLPVPIWILLVLAFLAGAATPPFEAARSALIPTIVGDDEYADAIALTAITYQMAIVAGYLSGGTVVAAAGARSALAVNAATFILSGLLISRLSVTAAPGRVHRASTAVRSAASALRSDPYIRRAVGFAAAVAGLAIIGESLVPVYVREELHGGATATGVVAAANPVGAILAATVANVRGDSRHLLEVSARLAFVGASIGAIGFLLSPPLPFGVLPFIGLGVVFASGIPANAVAGSRLPDELRSSAFGIVMGVLQGTAAASAALGGVLADWVGARAACSSALLAAVTISIWAWVRLPQGRDDGENSDRAV